MFIKKAYFQFNAAKTRMCGQFWQKHPVSVVNRWRHSGSLSHILNVSAFDAFKIWAETDLAWILITGGPYFIQKSNFSDSQLTASALIITPLGGSRIRKLPQSNVCIRSLCLALWLTDRWGGTSEICDAVTYFTQYSDQ